MTIAEEYGRGRHLVSALHVHLVFVTREFNGEDDHVHLLADYLPNLAISAPVNNLKGVPALQPRSQFTGQVNRHITHGHFWSPSYFAASCGGAPPGIIRQYIEQQRRPANATSGLTSP